MDMESVFGLLSRGSVFGLGIFSCTVCAHVVVCMLTIVLYSSLVSVPRSFQNGIIAFSLSCVCPTHYFASVFLSLSSIVDAIV